MTTLGSVAGRAQRGQRLLGKLNEALLVLEVDALGRRGEFSLGDKDIQRSRETLLEFVKRLRTELDTASTSADLRSLVGRLRSGMKPIGDWREDLDNLGSLLSKDQCLDKDALPILEDLLSLLDDEFAEDLRLLYKR